MDETQGLDLFERVQAWRCTYADIMQKEARGWMRNNRSTHENAATAVDAVRQLADDLRELIEDIELEAERARTRIESEQF